MKTIASCLRRLKGNPIKHCRKQPVPLSIVKAPRPSVSPPSKKPKKK